MTRYAPGEHEGQQRENEGQQREIDLLRGRNRHLFEEGISAVARLICMKSDLDAAARLVLDAGLATGHADTFEDLMREVLVEFAKVKADRDEWKALVDTMQQRGFV